MRWRRLLGLVLFALAVLTVADAPAQQQETRIALRDQAMTSRGNDWPDDANARSC